MIKREIEFKAWGNSQGFRLTKKEIEELGRSEGDIYDLEVSEGIVKITPKKEKPTSLEELFADYTGEPLDVTEVDWGDPKGEEIW